MYITLEADYAVRIVDCLARNAIRMDAKTLAAHTGVTLRFSLKILRKLVAEGIIRSYKGTQGGYELAIPAQEISLGRVIETVEGPIIISRCVGQGEKGAHEECGCSQSGSKSGYCRFNKTYTEVAQMVRERLYREHFGLEEGQEE